MKPQKWIAFIGLPILLIAFIAATVFAVPTSPSPAATPSPGTTSTVASTTETGFIQDYNQRRKYTQTDYDYVVAHMTAGYENLSVAEFNRLLLDWTDEEAFHRGENSISRLLCSYPDDKPNADFIDTTIRASYEEISTHHYGGTCSQMAPTSYNSVERTANEDVYGDKVPIYTSDASYNIHYRIQDENKITIGERDKIFLAYQDALQAYLDGKTEKELKDRAAMSAGLSKALALLDQTHSTENFTLISELNDYFMEDYRDWA